MLFSLHCMSSENKNEPLIFQNISGQNKMQSVQAGLQFCFRV